MLCNQLHFRQPLLTQEQKERARKLLLRNDCAWVREQMTSGKSVNCVYMVPHHRLMRMTEALEQILKIELGSDYVVGALPDPQLENK